MRKAGLKHTQNLGNFIIRIATKKKIMATIRNIVKY